MSGAALMLVLGAAVIHATWNALAKRGRDPMAILWWAGAIGSLIMTPFGIYILSRDGVSPSAVPFVVATVILHSVYFFTLARAYQSGEFSLVYPLARGLGVAIVPAAAFLLFDERLSSLGVAGIVLIGTGIFALNWRPGAWSEDSLLKPGTGWAVATVVLHSVYFFTLARAYQSGDFSLVYPLARGLGVAIVPAAAFLLFDERLSSLGVAGIVLIGTGIFALNWRPGAWSEDTLLKPGTGWAIATGLCIASYSLVDKGGVAHIHPPPICGPWKRARAWRSWGRCWPGAGRSAGSGARTGVRCSPRPS